MSYSWQDYAGDSPQRYDWQEYAGPVGTTMADFDRAEERRPLGENERAQENAKAWLSNYAAGIMTGGNKYQNLASSSSARRRERSSPFIPHLRLVDILEEAQHPVDPVVRLVKLVD
jgi:hypothetical protein